MPFRIGFEPAAGRGQRHVLADAGDDVLQRTPFGRVVEHVIDGDQRHPGVGRNLRKPRKPPVVVAAIEQAGSKPDGTARQGLRQPRQHIGELCRLDTRRRQHDQVEALDIVQEIRQPQNTVALLGTTLAQSQETRQPAPGGAILRISENVRRAVGEDEPRADRDADTCFLRLGMSPHHAGDRVAVGDAEAREPELLRAIDQLFRMRGTAQKGKIGGDGKLGIRGHFYSHSLLLT